MKLGFYTYSYIDSLGVEIEPVLETVAAAGYEDIDISATWRDDLDHATQVLAPHIVHAHMPLLRAGEVGYETLSRKLAAAPPPR